MAKRHVYRSTDGITIQHPTRELSRDEQEERFARIRWHRDSGRIAVEAMPGGGSGDQRVPHTADELLDGAAYALMRRIFAERPIDGTNLYLAWSFFRVVRRPGSPDAGKIDQARADLKAEMVRAELVTVAHALDGKANGSNGQP